MSEQVTRQRTLWEEEPLWTASPRRTVVTSRRPKDKEYDIVIVGGGISGALVAEAVCDGRRRVLLLDRRAPVEGSTLASTAMVQHEIDVPLHELAQSVGERAAANAWRWSADAVEALRRKAERLEIRCAMQSKATLFLAGTSLDGAGLRREAEARRDIGLDAEWLDGDAVRAQFGIDREAAIRSAPSASCNPAQLAAGLLRAARRRGLEVVEGVEVTDGREAGDVSLVALDSGELVAAGMVVFCTGYEFLETVAHEQHDVHATWALATAPRLEVPAWLRSHLVWEASDPYLYFRTSWDGRIIAGGADETRVSALEEDGLRDTKTRQILDGLRGLLDVDIPGAEYVWSAGFGVTPTGLPYVDLVPGCERTWAVMGFGGNGLTFSQIASERLGAVVRGEEDRHADLFRFPTAKGGRSGA